MNLEKGVIVGCDINQEWLLPWWWKHYSEYNTHPVAFIDFGMSEAAVKWCTEKGIYITIPNSNAKENVTVSETVKIQWEALYGDQLWDFRASWFKKPIACLSSPFTRSLWIDLDCEIKSNISPLFNSLSFGIEITLLKEHPLSQELAKKSGLIEEGEICFNSGVLGFIQNAPVLHHWAQLSTEHPELFPGDQQALSRAIYLQSTPYLELPEIYNWSWNFPDNPHAQIVHYHGQGKLHIINQLKNTN